VLIECLFATVSCSGLIHDLRDVFPSARMLVVSPDLDDESLADLVAAGAVGCLTPDCSRDELMDAIRRVSQGEILFPATLLMRLLARRQAPRREDDAAPSSADWDASTGRQAAAGTSGVDPPAALAPRERQVLTAMATGLSTEEVAERLGITVHTVRTHLRNVLVKLNAHSKLEAVVIALRKGLIELPE